YAGVIHYCVAAHPSLVSFPTRRSSDLAGRSAEQHGAVGGVRRRCVGGSRVSAVAGGGRVRGDRCGADADLRGRGGPDHGGVRAGPEAARVNVFRLLFLCTGNSARSQMAEALLNWKGRGRFQAESAASRPADRVNPHAIETLRDYDIPWAGHAPRSIDGLEREPWDFVITVCDRAKEACPIFPGQPILAHW